MGALPSKRMRGHVVFHCPDCFDDRLGRVQSSGKVECLACSYEVSSCQLARGPVGSSFGARITAATQSLFVAIVSAAEDQRRAAVSAVDAASPFMLAVWTDSDLEHLCGQPVETIRRRFVGDLILVAEDLLPDGRERLVSAAEGVAALDGAPTPRQAELIVDARRLMGMRPRR